MKIKSFLLCFVLVLPGCSSNGSTFEELIMTCRNSTYEFAFFGISGSFKRLVECPSGVAPAKIAEETADAEPQPAT